MNAYIDRNTAILALVVLLIVALLAIALSIEPAAARTVKPTPTPARYCCPVGSHCAHVYPPLPPCVPTPTPAPICRQGECWR